MLHRQQTSMASHHVLRDRQSCPLQSEKWQGAEQTGSTMLHWLQGLLLRSTDHAGPSTDRAAAGAELAGADHLHLCALWAAALLPAWACGGAAAVWELDGADHLCALRAAVRRLAVAGCWGETQSIPPARHNGTSTQLFTCPYCNSTRTHLLTHPSFGLEQGPNSD